ncbi:ABC transporter ATP-binding protein [Nocardioides sp. NPDC051685]|uniref:ABC transporter ATP-binding protein n=1 Tax=Nocardioides sp. NPDC051685 TaxID=3364334 RepID=UPI0037B70FA0
MSARVHDLSVRIGEREIVSGASLTVAGGRITALVGESGSGKTTLALTLLGEVPERGRVTGVVEVGGQAVALDRPVEPGSVGYVPQHPSAVLNPVRRIGVVLRDIARVHVRASTRRERSRLVDQRVREALRRAQLPTDAAFLRRHSHQLSGGQQQRLVLAQALVGNPRVLVADEPTTGQDAVTRGEVADELKTVAENGAAVLVLTHDLDLVRMIADAVFVMHRGRIVEDGRVEDVLERPRAAYTRRLVAAHGGPVATGPTGVADGDPLVSVRALWVVHRSARGPHSTLEDVSLDIGAGERLAVMGRSGSGKTTLARCVAGLQPFRAGQVLLDGSALSPLLRRRSLADLARIQYVFQDARASFSEFTPVLTQVARTAERLRGLDVADARARALEVLGDLGVSSEVAARRPGSLSGGELQRAALVRALLADPDLLICDEITSGLDAVTQADVLDLLNRIQRETACALMVITHDPAVAARLADRVVVVDDGRIV